MAQSLPVVIIPNGVTYSKNCGGEFGRIPGPITIWQLGSNVRDFSSIMRVLLLKNQSAVVSFNPTVLENRKKYTEPAYIEPTFGKKGLVMGGYSDIGERVFPSTTIKMCFPRFPVVSHTPCVRRAANCHKVAYSQAFTESAIVGATARRHSTLLK